MEGVIREGTITNLADSHNLCQPLDRDAKPLAGLPLYGAAVVGYFGHHFMDGMVVPFPGKRRR